MGSKLVMSNKLIINDRILFLGIGIFLLFSVGSFSVFIWEVFRYIVFILDVNPLGTLLIKESLRFITYLSGILIFINIIKKKKIKSLNLLISLFIILFLGQILQFLTPILLTTMFGVDYLNNTRNNELYLDPDFVFILNFLPPLVEYCLYITIGIIIYKNWNKFENLDHEVNQELNNIGKE